MSLRRKKHSHSQYKKRPIEHNGLYPYLARFLQWGSIMAGVSDETTKTRDAGIRRFIDWCDERGIHDPKEISLPILERYQRHLYYYRKGDGDPLSVSAQQSLLQSLKSFFKWLTREQYIPSNPASEMQLPRRPKKLPKVILHQEEILTILNQPDLDTPEGVRDRAMLEVLYATGLRRMELCNLNLYDIDHRRGALLIRGGKGNKDRMVPLGDRALAWIEKYLTEVHPRLITHQHRNHLFLTDYGEPFSRENLTAHIKKILNRAGIDKPGSCHLFRHACATHMLENGADIRFIQALLGHEDLTSTEIYTRVSIEKLKEIHAATHPAKLKTKINEQGEETLALLATLEWEAEQEQEGEGVES
ncbi:MAG: site-specific tyrosine recombinase XerC [Pseudomonadales bacterium]|jgi:integrase/recombinase XerD|nr:site-specific tyrosine recombinase XerC [Pseudomonadales bacterium]